MLESAISKAIIAWINDLPDGRARKVHQSAMAGKGEPDIMACVGGRCVVIETKRRGGRPTPLQAEILRRWEATGAVAFSAVSLEHVQLRFDSEGLL